MVYFCPICGGKAPQSLRSDLFAIITKEEQLRIKELNNTYKTLEEFTKAFGPPDHDKHTLSYYKLSDTANIYGLVHDGKWSGIFATRKQLRKLKQPE